MKAEIERTGVAQPWAPDLALAQYLTRRRETADKCLRGLRRDIDLPTMEFDAQDEASAAIIEALSRAIDQAEVW